MTQENVCGHQWLSASKLAHNSQVRACSASIYNHRTSIRKCVLEENKQKSKSIHQIKLTERENELTYFSSELAEMACCLDGTTLKEEKRKNIYQCFSLMCRGNNASAGDSVCDLLTGHAAVMLIKHKHRTATFIVIFYLENILEQ